MNITHLFKPEELKEKNDGNFQTICPDCGLQGERTEGFILFPETNTAYCHSSCKSFNFLECAALKLKIIKCLDGREKGEPTNLKGEFFIETIKSIEDEYGETFLENIREICNIDEFIIKKNVLHPGKGRLISLFVKDMVKEIKIKNILFYRPDLKQVIEIRKLKSITLNDGIVKQTLFSPILPNRFVTLIERFLTPQIRIWNIDKMNWVFYNKSITNILSSICLESAILQDNLPLIERIFTIPIPIIYNNELTFPKVGYDKRFNSWLSYDSPEIEYQDMKLDKAKEIIEFLFSEFCFQEPQDKTNAISGLLTPFLRGIFSNFHIRTPVTFYIANRERAGKDFCAGITGILYEGYAMEEPPLSNEDKNSSGSNEELKKKILAALIQGRKRLHFSNNKGHLNNAVFESFVTLEKYSDRLLGKNEILEFFNEMDFSLSGNIGITFTPDFANRSRFVRLFLDVEDANSREFKNPDLHVWVKNNRSLILSALYSFVRHWVEKGMIKGSIPFTSFPEWSSICGGIMESVGYDNPCKSDKEVLSYGGDKETHDMKKLYEICYEKYSETYITKDMIKQIVINDDDLFDDIDLMTQGSKIKFGNILNKFIGRYFSNIKLEVEDRKIRPSRWKFKFTKIIKPSLSNDTTKKNDHFPLNDGSHGSLGSLPPSKVVFNSIKYLLGQNTTKTSKTTIPQKIKSDREIQFWDKKCEETINIKPNHTKKEIFNWYKNNPQTNYKELVDKFGVGCLKFMNELVNEGKIKNE